MSSSSSKALAGLFALTGVLALASACDDQTTTPPVDNKVKKVVSEGCFATQNAPKGLQSQTQMTVHNEQRTFDWFVPDSHDGVHPIPMVFVFDGVTGKGANARATYPVEAAANGAAVFVYPDTDTTGTWDLTHGPENNPDVDFYDQMLAQLGKNLCIDTNRVFVTGFGAGASFSNQLGCFRGTDLRALASHAGEGPISPEFSQTGTLVCPEKPIAALITHGSADQVIVESDATNTRDFWGGVNGCRTGGLQTFETFAPCINLLGCSSDRPVTFCEIDGLDHTLWSEAAPATWAFFSQL